MLIERIERIEGQLGHDGLKKTNYLALLHMFEDSSLVKIEKLK